MVRVRIIGSAGGDLRVSDPQIQRGMRPNRRRLYRVSEAREERAANFDFDPDEAGFTCCDAARPFRRARRDSLVCNAIHGADAHR